MDRRLKCKVIFARSLRNGDEINSQF